MAIVSLDFLGTVQSVLRGIFDAVLVPVLREVFNIIVTMLRSMIREALSGIFLKIWITLLKFIDFLESIFSVFSGISQVKVNNVSDNQSIIEYLFTQPAVQKAMFMILAVSFVLAFLTTLIATVRSVADSIGENRRPISAVLRSALNSVVAFMLIPFGCTFVLYMITQILVQIYYAVGSNNKGSSLGDLLFFSIAGDYITLTGAVEGPKFDSGKRYQNMDQVKEYFSYKDFEYSLCFIASIFLIIILLATIVQMVQRLMMILILYIISPLFVAYMPLDEGKSFKKWRDMFVAFMISAFSPVIAMRVFFMMLPVMVSSDLQFPAIISPSVSKIIFILGGCHAIYTSRNMMVKIVNPSLGSQLDANSFLTRMIGGSVIGKVQRILRYGGRGGQQQQQQQSAGGNSGGGAGEKK